MDFSILSAKPQPIPLHAYAAMAALFLGALQLSMPKGTAFHRAVGFTWVVLMATVSVSSFFIVPNFKLIGPFSLFMRYRFLHFGLSMQRSKRQKWVILPVINAL